MNEVWRDVIGWEGKYRISNYGRGYSIISKKILKPNIIGKGYLRFCFYINSKPKTQLIHRLVGKHFIPNPNNLPEINHKDADKTNNNVSNLEWSTRIHNVRHAIDNNLINPRKGEDNPRSKLTIQDVKEIRNLKGQMSQRKIAKLYSVTKTIIHNIHNNINWVNV